MEVLVSMTILSLLLVILMSMVDSSTKIWRESENRVDSYREARAAVNMMATDLSSIFPSVNTNLFQLDKLANPAASIERAPDFSNLFFVTSKSSDAQDANNRSDLCIVGYYVAFAKVNINSPERSLNLYRYFKSSDDTFDLSLKKIATDPLIPSGEEPSPEPGIGDELIARNVTSFRVRAYTASGGGVSSDGSNAQMVNFDQKLATPMPNVVEIELTVVNNETAKRLIGLSAWKNTSSLDYKKNARIFTTRVRLPTDTAIAVTPTPTPAP